MDGILIATTVNAELQILGTGGQRTIHVWDQIVGFVRRTLGAEHAALFAEPNQDPNRGVTDWYASVPGEAAVLDTLPPPEREAATATLTRLHGEISAASERLRQSGREEERFLGEMLALALITPAPGYIRVVGRQPVLVAWGHTLVNAAMNPELLIGRLPSRAARGPAPQGSAGAGPMRIVGPPPPPVSQAWKYVLGALLLACLLLFLPLLFLLLDPLHLFRATAAQCVVAPSDVALLDELRTETQRESSLRDQIARVALEMGNRRAACPPRPAPTPTPTLEPKKEPPTLGSNELKIPTEKSGPTPMKFLEGCWKSDAGILETLTRKPIIITFCFDADGNGQRTLTYANGSTCKGPAKARLDGTKLEIKANRAPCSNGGMFSAATTQCRPDSDGTAHCDNTGEDESRPGVTNHRFFREGAR